MTSYDALYSHAVAERLDMHSTDIETMDLLNVLGSMTAGQLAERTALSSGATTRLIDRLERAGYVRRVPDESDRRQVIVLPVEEKMREVRALYEPMAGKMGRTWAQFSDEDLAVVLRFASESNAAVAEANKQIRGAPGG